MAIFNSYVSHYQRVRVERGMSGNRRNILHFFVLDGTIGLDSERILDHWRRKKYFLRVIPTLTHYSDRISDIPFGSNYGIYIYKYCDILSGILSGIYSEILSNMLSGIFGISIWHLLNHSFWHIWHLFWHSDTGGARIQSPELESPGRVVQDGPGVGSIHPELAIWLAEKEAIDAPICSNPKKVVPQFEFAFSWCVYNSNVTMVFVGDISNWYLWGL